MSDMEHLTPAVRNAVHYVERMAEDSLEEGTRRLPTISHMARDGGFSPRTLSRAVRHLRERGILSCSQRRGIVATGKGARSIAEGTGNTPPARLPRWEELRRRLSRAIIGGTYPPGTQLPSIGELCAEYGTSYHSLKRALLALVENGRLTPHRRGHRVPALGAATRSSSLVLVSRIRNVGDLGTVIPRHPEFLRLLERECLRLNLRLHIHQFARAGTEPFTAARAARDTAGGGAAVGYLLWTQTLAQADLQALIPVLGKTRHPVAVLDEDGIPQLPALCRPFPEVKTFQVANSTTAGVDMGNFLLAQGHRRIGYFSPVAATPYSRNRHEGMESVFEGAGVEHSTRSFTRDDLGTFEGVMEAAMKCTEFRTISGQLDSFRRAIEHTDTRVSDSFYGFYSDTYLLRRAIQQIMLPLFRRALNDESITAWVGVNDWIALSAYDYLRNERVPVPEHISLTGFDDTFEAFTHGLTSYDFNMPALVTAILEHVLRRRGAGGRKNPKQMEIPGVVTPRGSVSSIRCYR